MHHLFNPFQVTLIKSISGIRGTIGGKPGESLTPSDIVKFSAAFGCWINKHNKNKPKNKVVVGRDARISGQMVQQLVTGTLLGSGIDVVDMGLTTTPTAEMAVVFHKAQGGIILTASHNPKQWNALKLLNSYGEFISAADGDEILRMSENPKIEFAEVNKLGNLTADNSSLQHHIKSILKLPLVDKEAITNKKFKIVIDCINSTGDIAVPALLTALGVDTFTLINSEPSGDFAHNPEPLPENLAELSKEVIKKKANLGIAIDPDVDRLALVCEDGEMFGEEYTLVAVADYVLSHKKGNTVSNLSSTRE